MNQCVEHSKKWPYGRGGGKYVRRGLHILAWERANGPLPAGWHIHHTCKNPRCILPEHLEALPRREHKQRHAPKLSVVLASEIRAEYTALPRTASGRVVPGQLKRLGRKYGVSTTHLRNIIIGKKWAPEIRA